MNIAPTDIYTRDFFKIFKMHSLFGFLEFGCFGKTHWCMFFLIGLNSVHLYMRQHRRSYVIRVGTVLIKFNKEKQQYTYQLFS